MLHALPGKSATHGKNLVAWFAQRLCIAHMYLCLCTAAFLQMPPASCLFLLLRLSLPLSRRPWYTVVTQLCCPPPLTFLCHTTLLPPPYRGLALSTLVMFTLSHWLSSANINSYLKPRCFSTPHTWICRYFVHQFSHAPTQSMHDVERPMLQI